MTRTVLLAAALLATIALANALTSYIGLISAGFGLLVTAGTYAAGLSLALRDLLHDAGGVRWVLVAIVAGIGVSASAGDGRIALASAATFGLAELTDLAVYAPLRRRRWRTAVAVSGAVGALIDTLVFLALAGFPITTNAVGGQLLVKAVWVTGAFLLVMEVARRAVSRQRVLGEGA